MPLFDRELENRPVDPSEEFSKQYNHFFLAQKLVQFDPRSGAGKIRWAGYSLQQRVSYHQVTLPFARGKSWQDAPASEYDEVQDLAFSLSFVAPRTVRLRLAARPQGLPEGGSLMLDGEPPADDSWEPGDDGSSATYEGPFGSVIAERDPFHLEFRDAAGRLLTRTLHSSDAPGELNSLPVPLSFVRRSANLHRHLAATFSLAPGERLFGGGESFTRLDKHPDDPTCWTIEDEYLFGSDLLVAPLVEESRTRTVYLPPGTWIDYQGGKSYEGERWRRIAAGELPVIVLVRSGSAIPHAELAQSTDRIDWSEIGLTVFGAEAAEALFCLPEDGALHRLRLGRDGDRFVLEDNPLEGKVEFEVV